MLLMLYWLLRFFSGALLKETVEGCGSASPQICVSDLKLLNLKLGDGFPTSFEDLYTCVVN